MKLKTYITDLHQSTKRDYVSRMIDKKIECMKIAKKFDKDYWDGDRRFGYGGYKYLPGRWKPMAEKIIKDYALNRSSKVLDVGCGKAFLLYEIKKIIPSIHICGFDISKYAVNNAPVEVQDYLFVHNVEEKFPFKNKEFDLIISINTLHNLKLQSLKNSLAECQRVAKQGYIVVESFRNEEELFNLQCWALTCQSFFSTDEWLWIFEEFGYSGDYEFIYF